MTNDFGIGSMLAACVVALAGAWALVKFVAYDTLIKEIHEQRDELKELRDMAEKNQKTLSDYQLKDYHTQRKLDRVIDYSRMQSREMKDIIKMIRHGKAFDDAHIEKLESIPSIDDVLREFD